MQTILEKTIRQLRLDRKLSRQELSDMMFIDRSRSTLANRENGRRLPDAGRPFFPMKRTVPLSSAGQGMNKSGTQS